MDVGASAEEPLPGEGWAIDPTRRHELRWWDGRAWTDRVLDDHDHGRDRVRRIKGVPVMTGHAAEVREWIVEWRSDSAWEVVDDSVRGTWASVRRLTVGRARSQAMPPGGCLAVPVTIVLSTIVGLWRRYRRRRVVR